MSRKWSRKCVSLVVALISLVLVPIGVNATVATAAAPSGRLFVGFASRPQLDGSWLVTADGAVFASGAAVSYGDMSQVHLNKPILAMAPTADGKGYWLVASDGGIFSFGDAKFFGSTGSLCLNKPVVGMAATPTGNGYWMVASDGGIFAYGDARFYGSSGSINLAKPVVGMASTASGNGYWLVASDGGIFAYGDAKFYGSTGAITLQKPVIGMSRTPSGHGYWLAGSDGGVFSYGDATFRGSIAGSGSTVMAIESRTDGGYDIVSTDGAVTERDGTPSPAPATTTSTTIHPTTTTTVPPTTTTVHVTTTVPPTTTTTVASGMPSAANEPSAANTGPAAGTNLTVHNGDIAVTASNTVIDGLDVHGFIYVRAANVIIKNSIVRGGVATQNTGLINAMSPSVSNLTVQNCILTPDNPSIWIDGLYGHDFTATGVEIYNTVDGFGVFNPITDGSDAYGNGPANVLIQGSYVHNLAFIAPDTNHADGHTHNDGVQIQGNSNIQIIGNRFDDTASTSFGSFATDPWMPSATGQAIAITPVIGSISGVTIRQNWLDYGSQSITMIMGSFGSTTTATIDHNYFGRHQVLLTKDGVSAQRPILADSSFTLPGISSATNSAAASSNFYEDGTPIIIWRMVNAG